MHDGSRNRAVVEAVRSSTVKATAKRFGISPSRVCQIVKRHKLSILSKDLTHEEKEAWLAATASVEDDITSVLAAVTRIARNWDIRNRIVSALEERQLLASSEKTADASRTGHQSRGSSKDGRLPD